MVFEAVGVDYADPISVLSTRARGSKTTKGYFAIFICMFYRGIHIELVSDLTTDAFLTAFRRFVSRRGHCAVIMSEISQGQVRSSAVCLNNRRHSRKKLLHCSPRIRSCGTSRHRDLHILVDFGSERYAASSIICTESLETLPFLPKNSERSLRKSKRV